MGQPRDGDARASYAILELANEVGFEIRRVDYNIDAAASKIAAKGLPKVLADRLFMGF